MSTMTVSMQESGVVASVSTRDVGSSLTETAAAGTRRLDVEDNVDIEPGSSVTFTLDDDTALTYNVTGLDGDTGVLLSGMLGIDVPEGTFVAVEPAGVTVYAQVRLSEGGETVTCRVPHNLADVIRHGVRDEVTAETVIVDRIDDEFVVTEIIGRPTVRDLSDGTLDPEGDGKSLQDVIDGLDEKVDYNIDQILLQMDSLQSFASTRNRTYRQPDKPTGGVPGDSWYDTDDGNRLHIFDATANDFVVATGSHLMTPDGTLQWSPHGLTAYGPNGLTFALSAGSGSILMNGNLSAVEINGAIVTGGTTQTSDQVAKGVKLSDTGIAAYHPDSTASNPMPVLQFLTATGALAIRGDFTGGATVTGAMLQTSLSENYGLKMSPGGLWGYNNATGEPTFVVSGTTGSFYARGVFETGSSTGPRVTVSTALWGSQQWGMVQFHTATPGWNPGQVWSVYEGGYGVMRISSPYGAGLSWDRSSSLSLGTDANGNDYASLDAAVMYMNANNYYLGSNGTTVDFRLQNTSLFQVIGASGRFNFETALTQGGVAYNTLGSWLGTSGNTRKGLQILAGGQIIFNLTGTRNLTFQQPFNYAGVPSLIDSESDVALAWRNRTAANGYGFLHVTDWTGEARRDLRCGIIQTTSVDTSSDLSLKRNLTPVVGVLPLLLADEAAPQEYDLYDRDPDTAVYALADPVRHLGRRRGPIANDLVDVLPELVNGAPGSYTVDVYGLVSTLLAGLRELAARTDAEVADLRAQLASALS